jgi:hypothetical protein
MLRRFLFLTAGVLALLVGLGAPGQVHAQRMMRGGGANRVHPGFRGGFMPGFRGGFDPRFNRGFDRFEDRFDRGFDRRFDRFEDRFDRGFFDPRFSPGFGPGFFRPF